MNRKGMIYVLAPIVLLSMAHCDKAQPVAPFVYELPAPQSTPAETSEPVEIPYADEWKAFEDARASAQPMAGTYPVDPGQLVLTELSGERYVITALGAAILAGDRAQIDVYAAEDAELTAPIWYSPLRSQSSARTFPAHIAINAIYMKQADSEFLTFILSHGADVNAMETSYMPANQGLTHSQQSVLHHTITSEIPELTKIALDTGVRDMTIGAVSDDANVLSPLDSAILRGNVEAVRLLIAAGVDPTVGKMDKNGNMHRPVDWAKQLARKKPESAERMKEIIALLETSANMKP